MLRSRSTSASPTSGNIFSGVRFVLFGFDSVSEAQYRSELVRRGGVEVGRYDEKCTHVIVCGRVYDDPVCVAAREDGKMLVTELWVDDCLELEMLVDAARILYKPVKDLNGIPGSESLHICLTGYQRQGRDYIMKMVSLMGAKFTKPLIANQVTHLICYKFEGEKYQLAKKVNIKLVNHRWLEDCLKAWQILPIDGYRKSGWELEVLENEAKDSEDEAGDIGIKLMRRTSVGTSVGGGKSTDGNFDMPVSSMGRTSAQKDILAERNVAASDFGITNTALFSTPSKESNPSKVLDDCEPRSMTFQQVHSGDAGQHAQMGNTRRTSVGTSVGGGKSTDGNFDMPVSSMGRASAQKDLLAERNVAASDFGITNTALFSTPSKKRNPSKVLDDCEPRSMAFQQVHSGDAGQHAQMGNTRRTSVGTSVGGGKSTDGNFDMPVSSKGRTSAQKDILAERNVAASDFGITNTALFPTPSKESNPSKVLDGCEPRSMTFQQVHSGDAGQHAQMGNTIPGVDAFSAGKHCMSADCNLRKEGAVYSSAVASTSTATEGKLSYSRQTQRKLSSPDQPSGNLSAASATTSGRGKPEVEFDGSSADANKGITHGELVKTPTKASGYHVEQSENALPQKGLASFTGANSNSFKSDCQNVKSPIWRSPSSINPDQLEATAFSPQGKDHFAPDQEKSALEYAAFSNSVTKCGNALPQKRKASISRAKSNSSKSDCQIVKSPIQQSLPKVKYDQLEATAFSPQGKDYLDPEQEKSALEYAALSNSLTKQQGRLIHSKSLSYNRPQKRGKAVQESAQPNKKVSLSEKPGKPTLRLGSGGHKDNLNYFPAKLATMALPDLPLHNEQDGCMPKITRNTRNQLYSSVISGNLANATSCEDMDSDKPLNELDEYDPATGTGNINANDKTHSIALEEPAKTHKRQQQEEGDSLNGYDAVANSVSHVTADTPNREKLHVKKAVAKRSMNRTKLGVTHNRKSEQNLHLDKNDISNQSFKSRETEESKGLTKFDKLKLNMMDAEVRPFHEDVVVMNRTEVAAHPVPPSIYNNVSMDLMDASCDADKENVANLHSNCQNDLSNNVVLNQDDQKFQKSVSKVESTRNKNFVRLEPAWFILSGHRLQRKEFQGMIKQLRGRVCKDSHKWSYQATHFVVPDPIRRTEKFFAAAAAGRWILKTDYLTTSKEAGKFLDEEPYEWYRKGLTEDGAISLEAPRRWRLLRERTGHGALYGMRIIVYGDCIAPTLDTLKRVIKAGDGTIVATSPPYSRAIKPGVDYAVVSPSMPRVDCWIQEFLRHEIPCISADYLVEYVCKPGYSLERHVLYNTHSWAEKSSAKLSTLSEEITKEAASLVSEESNGDLSCAVCKSCDRGEVMLICGNEAGTVGCGIGTHIDCCDPPLEVVPEEDWFCPKCIDLSNKDPPKSKKKKSLTKRK